MPDERDALAQAQAEQAASSQRMDAIDQRVMSVESGLDALDEKTTEGINKVADAVAETRKLVGKDGIKVEWPFIGLDRGRTGQDDEDGGNSSANQYPVNLMVNARLRVITFLSLEEPGEPDVD